MKKIMGLCLQFVISMTLLGYLFWKTDFSELSSELQQANPWWLMLAFSLLFVGKLLTGYRWQTLLTAHQIRIPLSLLINSLFVGQFFNSFLPSMIGGDTVRAYDTVTYSGQRTEAITTVVVDRLVGVFALALLGIVAFCLGLFISQEMSIFAWFVIGMMVLATAALALLFSSQVGHLLKHLLERLRLAKLSNKLNRIYETLATMKEQKGKLLVALFLSLALQVNVIFFYAFVGFALGLDVSLLYYFVIIPIVLVVTQVPMTINGLGLREGIYVFLLGMIGVAPHSALAFSLVAFGLMLSQGIIGGFLFGLRAVNLTTLRTSVVAGGK